MNVEDIAKVCHEANKAFCATHLDRSHFKWEDAPPWQRASAIKGVEFHIKNPEALDSHSHDSWMKEKLATGWKFGSTKDDVKKEHPCLVPFNELAVHEQAKDALFRAIVHALSPMKF